jgi:hypothetical protein
MISLSVSKGHTGSEFFCQKVAYKLHGYLQEGSMLGISLSVSRKHADDKFIYIYLSIEHDDKKLPCRREHADNQFTCQY